MPHRTAPYSGQGGIPVDNLFRRALFAWNFRDINLLLSNQITDTSRLMIYRNIEQRAAKAVPFLTFDSDPYLAIIDGQPAVDPRRVHDLGRLPVLAER